MGSRPQLTHQGNPWGLMAWPLVVFAGINGSRQPPNPLDTNRIEKLPATR